MTDTINEQWFSIPEYKGFYSITRSGKIKNDRTGHILSFYVNKKGYKCVDLATNGERHKCRLHQLLAHTFIGEQKKGFCVRHLDGNSMNNSIENLAYGTQSDNEKDSVKHGTHYRNCKITPDIARKIAMDKRPYKLIASDFNLSRNYISDIKSGIYWGRETQGIRFQRGIHNPSPRKQIFSEEETKYIADKNHSYKEIRKRIKVSDDVIRRIRREYKISV